MAEPRDPRGDAERGQLQPFPAFEDACASSGKSLHSANDADVPSIVANTRMITVKWEFVVSQRQAQWWQPFLVTRKHNQALGTQMKQVRSV